MPGPEPNPLLESMTSDHDRHSLLFYIRAAHLALLQPTWSQPCHNAFLIPQSLQAHALQQTR